LSEKQHKMVDKKDTHCYECGGKGIANGYECNTCDGKGNLNLVEKPKKKK